MVAFACVAVILTLAVLMLTAGWCTERKHVLRVARECAGYFGAFLVVVGQPLLDKFRENEVRQPGEPPGAAPHRRSAARGVFTRRPSRGHLCQ